MATRLLFVDDEPNVLAALRRIAGDRWEVDVATGGAEALDMIESSGPYAVILADMRMPGMNGVQLLREVAQVSPMTTRMMLTGNLDQVTSVQAVNEGHVFSYLNKPCGDEVLLTSLQAAVVQHELLRTKNELLEKTVAGSVSLLGDVLSYMDPVMFGEAQILRSMVRKLSSYARYENAWQIEIAAVLASVGIVSVPHQVASKVRSGNSLTEAERALVSAVPRVGYELLIKIPYLEPVAEIVLYQEMQFNGNGFPNDGVSGESIPLGARVLRVLKDLRKLESETGDVSMALTTLKLRRGWYDPTVLDVATHAFGSRKPPRQSSVVSTVARCLRPGQVAAKEIVTVDGWTLVEAEQTISADAVKRVMEMSPLGLIQEPIYVYSTEAA